MNINSISLGKRIKMEREERNLSIGEFAEFLNIPESLLNDMENGILELSLEDTYNMLTFFKTPFDGLLTPHSTDNESDEQIIELAKYCDKFGFETVLEIMRNLDRTSSCLNIKASK